MNTSNELEKPMQLVCIAWEEHRTANYFEVPLDEVTAIENRILSEIATVPGARIRESIFYPEIPVIVFYIET